MVTSLERSTVEPQSLAPRSVRKSLAPFGRDDIRYVMSIQEEIEMYKKVTVEQIRSLHAEFLSNQAGEVSIVGDFDRDEIKTLLKDGAVRLGNIRAIRPRRPRPASRDRWFARCDPNPR